MIERTAAMLVAISLPSRTRIFKAIGAKPN